MDGPRIGRLGARFALRRSKRIKSHEKSLKNVCTNPEKSCIFEAKRQNDSRLSREAPNLREAKKRPELAKDATCIKKKALNPWQLNAQLLDEDKPVLIRQRASALGKRLKASYESRAALQRKAAYPKDRGGLNEDHELAV